MRSKVTLQRLRCFATEVSVEPVGMEARGEYDGFTPNAAQPLDASLKVGMPFRQMYIVVLEHRRVHAIFAVGDPVNTCGVRIWNVEFRIKEIAEIIIKHVDDGGEVAEDPVERVGGSPPARRAQNGGHMAGGSKTDDCSRSTTDHCPNRIMTRIQSAFFALKDRIQDLTDPVRSGERSQEVLKPFLVRLSSKDMTIEG